MAASQNSVIVAGAERIRQVIKPSTSGAMVGPGRILDEGFQSVGRWISRKVGHHAHKLGWGPVAVAERIKQALQNDAHTREEELCRSFELSSRAGTSNKLTEDCFKLMKHALP
jgi:hypothetical protein